MSATSEAQFHVCIRSTGALLPVPAGTSILEVLRAHGIDQPSSCEAGVCGTCRTRYLDGEVEHLDAHLLADEQAEFLMVCVSRARSAVLTLDL